MVCIQCRDSRLQIRVEQSGRPSPEARIGHGAHGWIATSYDEWHIEMSFRTGFPTYAKSLTPREVYLTLPRSYYASWFPYHKSQIVERVKFAISQVKVAERSAIWIFKFAPVGVRVDERQVSTFDC